MLRKTVQIATARIRTVLEKNRVYVTNFAEVRCEMTLDSIAAEIVRVGAKVRMVPLRDVPPIHAALSFGTNTQPRPKMQPGGVSNDGRHGNENMRLDGHTTGWE